jgi:3D (Asp-Asp-Asp) domain-containing protein
MTLDDDGLVLSLGTVLAGVQARGAKRPVLALDGAEERLLALLSVAYGRAIDPHVLGNIRRASTAWRAGETCLALIHLARTGLSNLPDEEATYRLFAADSLLASGLGARHLLESCDIDTAMFDLLKAGFNPDEARVPAGEPDAGQWTPDGSGTSSAQAGADTGAGEGSGQPTPELHGYATVYHDSFAGKPTATGEVFDQHKMTAAVLPGTIPLRSVVTVTLDSDPRRSVEVYVNDHGLYHVVTNPDGSRSREPLPGRVIDLSSAAFRTLTGTSYGKVMVTVTVKSGPRR